VVYDFIDASYGDRIGVVAFAGDASVVCPLTTDHGSAISFIDRLSTNEPLRPGTGIGNAIHVAVNRFRDSEAGRVLILLTDGENNKGLEISSAVEEAKLNGVTIYTVGIGTPNGAPLPETTQPVVGSSRNRTDSNGDEIMVGLDAENLQMIANETGGSYFPVSNQGELSTLYSRITHEGTVEFQSRRMVRRDELAPFFLLLASLFLIMEAFYSYITPAEVRHAKANA
jgi:Ca-activated chloride channel homolog